MANNHHWRNNLHIDSHSSEALFAQIKNSLKRWINQGLRDGTLSPGDRVPSEHELTQELNVSGITVKRALNELQQEGVIQRLQGRGSFIARPQKLVLGLERLYSLTSAAQASGLALVSRTLQLQELMATANIAQKLKIEVGAPIAKLVRLRVLDEEPLAVDTSYLPMHLFPDLMEVDFNTVSLYDFMGQHHLEPIRARESLEPVLTNAFEAKALNVGEGSPAMLIERLAYSAGDVCVEFNKGIIRGDRCRFSVDMLKQHL